MKEYEILYIIKPNLGDEKYKEITEKIKEIITKNEGDAFDTKIIGMKTLAQPLSKFKQGYYVQIHFNATNNTLTKLQKHLEINEDVFRHLIVILDSIRPKKTNEKASVKG
jgi:small subunit ribosomal protein S6